MFQNSFQHLTIPIYVLLYLLKLEKSPNFSMIYVNHCTVGLWTVQRWGSFSIKSRFNVCKRFYLDQSRTNSTFLDQTRKSVTLGNFCLKLAGINGEGLMHRQFFFLTLPFGTLLMGYQKIRLGKWSKILQFMTKIAKMGALKWPKRVF